MFDNDPSSEEAHQMERIHLSSEIGRNSAGPQKKISLSVKDSKFHVWLLMQEPYAKVLACYFPNYVPEYANYLMHPRLNVWSFLGENFSRLVLTGACWVIIVQCVLHWSNSFTKFDPRHATTRFRCWVVRFHHVQNFFFLRFHFLVGFVRLIFLQDLRMC